MGQMASWGIVIHPPRRKSTEQKIRLHNKRVHNADTPIMIVGSKNSEKIEAYSGELCVMQQSKYKFCGVKSMSKGTNLISIIKFDRRVKLVKIDYFLYQGAIQAQKMHRLNLFILKNNFFIFFYFFWKNLLLFRNLFTSNEFVHNLKVCKIMFNTRFCLQSKQIFSVNMNECYATPLKRYGTPSIFGVFKIIITPELCNTNTYFPSWRVWWMKQPFALWKHFRHVQHFSFL